MQNKNLNYGFTLIELMIVVAILAVLSAVAIVGYTKWTRAAKNAEANSILADIRIKQEAYRATFRQYAGAPAANSGAAWGGWAPKESLVLSSRSFLWTNGDVLAKDSWAQLGITPTGKHFFFKYLIEANRPGQPTTKFTSRNIDTTGDFWFAARAIHDLDENGQCEGFEIYSTTDTIHKLDESAAACAL